MFDGIVARYDVLNRLLSLGMDSSWRRATVAAVEPRPGDVVLDLGCGTGDLTALLAGRASPVGIDVSWRMLQHAYRRFPKRAALVRGSAFELPFRDASFDGAVSGFVLRNLRDLEGAMAELARVIRPGGRIALLDATEPPGRFRSLFDAYFKLAAAVLGRLTGKPAAYRYLAASLTQIPPAPAMCALLERAGFEQCAARRLSLGAVTLFTARRPPCGQ